MKARNRIHTMNQWDNLCAKEKIAAHTASGQVMSMKGFNHESSSTGFVGAAGSERALSWMAKRGKVSLGPALKRKIRFKERNRDGYLL